MLLKEVSQLAHIIGDRAIWQALEEHCPVLASPQSTVQNRQNPPVFSRPDQPTEALSQSNDGFRNRVLDKGILPLGLQTMETGRDHRFTRYLERQFINDHYTKCVTLNINSLPKTESTAQHTVRGALEAFEEHILRLFTLDEERIGQVRRQRPVDAVHLAKTGE